MKARYKAVLFDLGGTLAHYWYPREFPSLLSTAIDATAWYLQAQGVETPDFVSLWSSVRKENHEAADFRVRPLERRLQSIFRLKDGALPGEASREFIGPLIQRGYVYDDVLSTLWELRRREYKIGLVSNTPWGSSAATWHEEAARLGLARVMDTIVFCGDVGWRKPAAPIFAKALDQLELSPSEVIFVGDDPRWDRVGPQRLGMATVLINRSSVGSPLRSPFITSLEELWLRI